MKTHTLSRLALMLAIVFNANLAADEPDNALLKAGGGQLKELKYAPLGVRAETDAPASVTIEPGNIARATNVIVTLVDDGISLSGNPRFDVRDGSAFFNMGQNSKITVGGIELKKGECAVLKDGKLQKLDIKLSP